MSKYYFPTDFFPFPKHINNILPLSLDLQTIFKCMYNRVSDNSCVDESVEPIVLWRSDKSKTQLALNMSFYISTVFSSIHSISETVEICWNE